MHCKSLGPALLALAAGLVPVSTPAADPVLPEVPNIPEFLLSKMEDPGVSFISEGDYADLLLSFIHDNRRYSYLPQLARHEPGFTSRQRSLFVEILGAAQKAGRLDKDYYNWVFFVADTNPRRLNRRDIFTIGQVIEHNPSKETTPFVKKLLHHPERGIRREAFRLAAILKDDRLMPDLLSFLSHQQSLYRVYALEAFAIWQDQRVEFTISNMLKDPNKSVRMAVLSTMAAWPNGNRFYFSQAYREDAHYEVRAHSVELIGRYRMNAAAFTLNEAVADSHPLVRQKTLEAIAVMRYQNAGYALAAQLEKESESALQEGMVDLLTKFDFRGGGAGLAHAMLKSQRVSVRRKAAVRLGELKPWGHTGDLTKALEDKDNKVKIKAAWALGELGDGAAWPALAKAMDADPSPQVRMACLDAVEKLDRSESIVNLYDKVHNHNDPTFRKAVRESVRRMLKKRFGE